MTEHEGFCGPSRGGFRVCYCTCPDCRTTVDGRPVCVCVGCRALKACPGNREDAAGPYALADALLQRPQWDP